MDRYTQEQIIKGLANHRRIDALFFLASCPDASVEEIAEACHVDYKTMAAHLKRMTTSGLVIKKPYGRRVEHRITPRGEQALQYISSLA